MKGPPEDTSSRFLAHWAPGEGTPYYIYRHPRGHFAACFQNNIWPLTRLKYIINDEHNSNLMSMWRYLTCTTSRGKSVSLYEHKGLWETLQREEEQKVQRFYMFLISPQGDVASTDSTSSLPFCFTRTGVPKCVLHDFNASLLLTVLSSYVTESLDCFHALTLKTASGWCC